MPDTEKNYQEKIYDDFLSLLEQKQYGPLIRMAQQQHPIDIAACLELLDDDRRVAVFRMLQKDCAAEVFAELDSDVQEMLISTMTDRELSGIIEELFSDDAVTLLQEMPANVVKRIMRSAKSETRKELNRLLDYPEDSAGSVMTGEFLELHKNMTRAEAVAHIRKTGDNAETVYVAYVTDAQRHLEGSVTLGDLLFAEDQDVIENFMSRGVPCVMTHDDRETVSLTVSKYDLVVLPVVDKENRLVGVVTFDDAMDVMEEEVTEDIEKMAAILPSDKPYLKDSVFEIFRRRIPWLLVLMLSATVTGAIITHYETALGGWVILTAFMPMIMGTGGNAGGQSSMTVIRSLSVGDIELRDAGRVLWKETRVALLCGIIMGIATFVKVFLIDLHMNVASLPVAAVISLTLVVTVVMAKIVGSMLPIAVKRIGLDPAVMASPFVTTIVDALSLVVYFEIASALLGV
ncbi:MAG: magnesium transporter [Clostridia bacterium]|nr:magnesium transporter [Clostridia bacterium]